MKSILIKDTTKEERERIVAEALGLDSYSDCGGSGSFGVDYQKYIDGEKELRELNEEYHPNIIQGALVSRDESSIKPGCPV